MKKNYIINYRYILKLNLEIKTDHFQVIGTLNLIGWNIVLLRTQYFVFAVERLIVELAMMIHLQQKDSKIEER